MDGVGWDIEVQVHFFLVKSCLNPTLLNANGEIHEVAVGSLQTHLVSFVSVND